MYYLRLIGSFARASAQAELAYRANFWLSLFHSLLALATGVVGVLVLYGQVETIHGWDMASTLALLGVFLILSAVRGLFLGPSLEALAGMDGEVWTGRLDYTLLRPVNAQFLASFRHWRPFALIDLALGIGVVAVAVGLVPWAPPCPSDAVLGTQGGTSVGVALSPQTVASFLLAMAAAVTILYAALLAFCALTLWNPGLLFTWILDGMFGMARYPVGLYPGWLRLILTWVVPVGLMTTLPAEALMGRLSGASLAGSLAFAAVLFAGASLFFRLGLRRYASASS
jgi:ABC-2 type transport system permease protein